jgi:AcrR family transcriptional regulator
MNLTDPQPPASDAASRRSPVPRRRGQSTRAALLRGAREVFERDGYLDARIADIAAAAGVATGSFYTHFRDKKEIFAALMEELQEDMLHPGVHHATSSRDAVAMIEEANRAYLDLYRRNAKLMKLLEQVATIDEDFMEMRRQRSLNFAKRNARAIRRLQEQGKADPNIDPLVSSLALGSMVSRTAYAVFSVGVHPFDFELLVRTLTELWVNALQMPADGATARRRAE